MKRTLAWTLLAGVMALSGAAQAQRPPPARPITGMVNLNTATEKQIELLPAVGPKRAKAIIAWRTQNHFLKVDDLAKVKGLGKGVISKIKDHVAVSGPTTIAPIGDKAE